MKFEEKLKTLETLLTAIESGDTGLDESMKLFEQAITLRRELSEALAAYEGKLEELILKNGVGMRRELENHEEDEDDEF